MTVRSNHFGTLPITNSDIGDHCILDHVLRKYLTNIIFKQKRKTTKQVTIRYKTNWKSEIIHRMSKYIEKLNICLTLYND